MASIYEIAFDTHSIVMRKLELTHGQWRILRVLQKVHIASLNCSRLLYNGKEFVDVCITHFPESLDRHRMTHRAAGIVEPHGRRDPVEEPAMDSRIGLQG